MIHSRIKRILAPLVSAPIFDFWAGRLNPLWSWERPLALVCAMDTDEQGHCLLQLRVNSFCRAPAPGQWLPLTLETAGRRRTLYSRAMTSPSPRFFYVRIPGEAPLPIRPGDVVEPGNPGEKPPPAGDHGTDSFRVTLLRSGATVRVDSGLPLLQGLEAAGISPEHGCRRGLCNRCACVRVRGQTRNAIDGETNGEPGAMIRLCISRPRSDLLLDL